MRKEIIRSITNSTPLFQYSFSNPNKKRLILFSTKRLRNFLVARLGRHG